MTKTCVLCGFEWNVSVKDRTPNDKYVCMNCARHKRKTPPTGYNKHGIRIERR